MQVKQETIANGQMFAEYIDWRVDNPSDDLMTALLNAEFEDETGTTRRLTRDEVLTYTQVVAGAGNETTGRLIGWLGKVLGDHPDQRRRDRRRPVADPEHDRGDAAVRAHRAPRRAVRRSRRRVLRHDGARRAAPSCCSSARPTATSATTRTPTASTSIETTASTSPSGTGCTSASAPRWRASRAGVALDEVLNRFPDWEVDHDNTRLAPTSTVRGLGVDAGRHHSLTDHNDKESIMGELDGKVAVITGRGVGDGPGLGRGVRARGRQGPRGRRQRASRTRPRPSSATASCRASATSAWRATSRRCSPPRSTPSGGSTRC